MTSTTIFEVRMHHELVNELDYGFSPMDGLAAINDIFVGLPLVHPSPARKQRRTPKRLRLYTGRFKWYPRLGFSYVQLGNELHVIELWYEEHPERRPVDVVLPETELEEHPASDYPIPAITEPEPDTIDRSADDVVSETKSQEQKQTDGDIDF